jgi:hypothetical protein
LRWLACCLTGASPYNSGFFATSHPADIAYVAMNESVPYKLKYELCPEDGIFVVRRLDIDVTSNGATDVEAIELHFRAQ